MHDPFDDPRLERFRAAQRRAHSCLRRVEAGLEGGISESEVARRIRREVLAAGAEGFFHEPLVWFGKRTALRGKRRRKDAFPGRSKLASGQAVILDVAPIFDGCAVDVSRTCALGHNAIVDEGRETLERLRVHIPEWVGAGQTARELCQSVARLAAEHGFESRQDSYMFGALGHRLFLVPRAPLRRASVLGIGVPSMIQLFGRALLHRVPGVPCSWPFWNDSKRAERAPSPGLWSVEPHIARGDVGLKWEEMLVIDEHGARWLDPSFDLARSAVLA